MYMKAPKQKNAKHAKIEIKKIESQKKNKSCNATVKKKAKATRNDYNIIYSIYGTTDNRGVTPLFLLWRFHVHMLFC